MVPAELWITGPVELKNNVNRQLKKAATLLFTTEILFLHLAPGEHPNYPAGKEDNTHFNELGAGRMAEIVLATIRSLKLDLADRIVKPANTK